MDTIINSKAYWEQRFLRDWDSSGGRKQSAFFAHITINNLPHWFVHDVRVRELSICDWGCAFGDGTNLVARHFINSKVTGIDISAVAVSEARKLYRSADYENLDLIAENRHFDVIFTSNTLEHFRDPWDVLSKLAERCRSYICVLVPFNDDQEIAEHLYTFRYENLRVSVGGVFSLVFLKVIDSSELPKTMWNGQQVLLIYACDAALSRIAEFGSEIIGPAYQEAFVLPSLRLATERLAQANIHAQDLTIKLTSSWEHTSWCDQRISALEAEKGRLAESVEQLESRAAEDGQRIKALEAERMRLAETIDQIEGRAARDGQFIKALESERVRLAKGVERVQSRCVEGDHRIKSLEAERVRLAETVERLERRAAELATTLNACRREWKQQTRAIKSSLSWRLTKPIRALGSYPWMKIVGKRGHEDRPQALGETWALAGPETRLETGASAELDTLLSRYPEKQVVVLRPLIDWDIPLFQRPQHIARQLANKGFLYFYCTPNAARDKVSGYVEIEPNLVLTDRYSELLSHPVSKIVHLYSTSTTLLAGEIGDLIDLGASLIYEYVDEISEDISSMRLPPSIYFRHRAVLADDRILCIVTADSLLSEVCKYRSQNYVMAGNGVDYEHFAFPTTTVKQVDVPHAIASLMGSGRPIIGYFGAFARWFDYETVRRVAISRPEYSWLLIGWDYDGSIRASGFDEVENIYVIGPISYELLPAYAKHFSVSTIPFLINNITLSTSPIKLFEYMALGHPIVTTSLPECRKYRSAIIAESGEDFANKIDFALKLRGDESYLSILREEGMANTWAAKAELIAGAITEDLRAIGNGVSASLDHSPIKTHAS